MESAALQANIHQSLYANMHQSLYQFYSAHSATPTIYHMMMMMVIGAELKAVARVVSVEGSKINLSITVFQSPKFEAQVCVCGCEQERVRG